MGKRFFLFFFSSGGQREEGVRQPQPPHPRGLTVLKLGKRLSGDVPLSLKVRKCLMSKGG